MNTFVQTVKSIDDLKSLPVAEFLAIFVLDYSLPDGGSIVSGRSTIGANLAQVGARENGLTFLANTHS